LLTQVDAIGVMIASACHGDDGFGPVHKGDDDVDAGFERGVVFSKPFHNFSLALRDDDKAHLHQHQSKCYNHNQENR